jgi:predicted nucleotidyltransferase
MDAHRRAVHMTTVPQVDEAPSLELLSERRSEILEIVRRHGGSNLRVYGSVVRGTAGPGSDIDLLIDMEDGSSLLDLATLHLELEDLLGFPVEIATDVKARLRGRVHDEAVPL